MRDSVRQGLSLTAEEEVGGWVMVVTNGKEWIVCRVRDS